MSETDPQRWDAALYRDRHAFVFQKAADLIDVLAPRGGERVLDVGCGTGELTAGIASRGADVLGVDASADMVAAATKAFPQVRFVVADARALPFDGGFDAVFSNATLHWVRDADAAAGSIARALKPGGRFVAEFGGHGNVAGIVRAIDAALADLSLPRVPLPWYYPTVGQYASVLERAGLEVRRAELFDRPTDLAGPHGLRNWVTMFGGAYLASVPDARRDAFFAALESYAPQLRNADAWFADYRRLRVVAVKPAG
jgi:SAM-dependent methyltransferase